MTLTVEMREFNEDGEAYFVAECRELPGCVSEGDTEEEARVNIMEAVKLCLSVMMEDRIVLATGSSQSEPENAVSISTLHLNAETELEYA